MDTIFAPEFLENKVKSKYKEKINPTHTYIPDSTTGKPIDNKTSIGQKQTTTPNPSKWPVDIASDPFVQSVLDDRNIFAQHELEYLDNNCPDDIFNEYDEMMPMMDELEKRIDEDIFREILDEIEDAENPFEDPDDHRDWTQERPDWTNPDSTPYIGDNYQKLDGMYEEQRTIGMFETEEEVEQAIKIMNGNE